jgi:hypothetical protein
MSLNRNDFKPSGGSTLVHTCIHAYIHTGSDYVDGLKQDVFKPRACMHTYMHIYIPAVTLWVAEIKKISSPEEAAHLYMHT